MTVSRSQRVTLLRRSSALRQAIDSSQVRNADSPGSPASFRKAVTNASCATSSASVGRAEGRKRGPEDGPAVALDQLAERVGVSGLRLAHQVQVDGRHRGSARGHTTE